MQAHSNRHSHNGVNAMNMTKPALAALLLAAPAANLAAQEVSANLGYNSEYIFRGIPQKSSSAFGGFDYANGGFYLGTWAADVGEGLEVDYYGGYTFDLGEVDLTIGGTWYTYTDDFDDDYKEINVGLAWEWLSFDAAIGEYDNFGGPTLDYEFYSLTVSHNGFYGILGTFTNDFDGNYYEAGYGGTLEVGGEALLDYGVAVIYSDSTLLGGDSDTNLVFTLSKGFDL